jgi:CheY-like chemotaxis protein
MGAFRRASVCLYRAHRCVRVEAVSRIRTSEGAGQRLGIIGVSGNARPAHVLKALSTGFDVFLTKPYRIEELLAVIDRVAASRRRLYSNGLLG